MAAQRSIWRYARAPTHPPRVGGWLVGGWVHFGVCYAAALDDMLRIAFQWTIVSLPIEWIGRKKYPQLV